MKIPENCRQFLLGAEGKALATYSNAEGLNVVPVSSLRLEGEQIILVNYFFDKTLKNIAENPSVALTAWIGLTGCQVKATAVYETSGEQFDAVVAWINETIPGRAVKGILVLTPTAWFDVSAGPAAGQRIAAE